MKLDLFRLTPEDLLPLAKTGAADVVVRPSLSYWQNAWRRLKRNRRAMVSLYMVVLLLLFSYVAPLLFELDGSSQDLTQLSQTPGLERHSRVVDPGPWVGQFAAHAPAEHLSAVENLQEVGEPHTEFVRLVWSPVAGASYYRIWRHILKPSGPTDLGLPLGETEFVGQVSFEDRLKLKTVDYYYSVEAIGPDEQVSPYSTVKIRPRHAISVGDAISRGLITPEQGEQAIGTEVTLKSHLFGTDYLGRDMLARLVQGGQTSLFIGIVAPLLFVVLGIVYGGLAGYLGGRIDEVMMRFADFVIALPFLLFMILFRVAMGIGPGESGIVPMLLAMVLLSWPSVARLVRGQVLQLREQPFVDAARLMGAGSTYLIFRHMLPNVMGVVLVSLTFAIPSAIFTEAFLSFIGMGVAPPTPSWGSMCNDGVKSFMSHPHELLFPALMISITVLAFNLLGDGLRDALDAKIDE